MLRQLKCRPLALFSGQLHVGQLNLATGEAVLNIQIQSDQSKRELNRFVLFSYGLSGKCVSDMLMHEFGIAL